MIIGYLQLQPGSNPPEITELRPFRCVVVVEEETTDKWRWLVSIWLVESGCLWMMAWGEKCGLWEDDVDYANLEQFNYGDIPKADQVMTSWHATDPVPNRAREGRTLELREGCLCVSPRERISPINLGCSSCVGEMVGWGH